MELSDGMLRAIGLVAVETAKLEYFIAYLVAVIRDGTEDDVREWLAKTGRPRRELTKLVADGVEPQHDLKRLEQAVTALLDDRGRLLHSVSFRTIDDDGSHGSALRFWHPKSDTEATIETWQVLDHVADVANTSGRILRLAKSCLESRVPLACPDEPAEG